MNEVFTIRQLHGDEVKQLDELLKFIEASQQNYDPGVQQEVRKAHAIINAILAKNLIRSNKINTWMTAAILALTLVMTAPVIQKFIGWCAGVAQR